MIAVMMALTILNGNTRGYRDRRFRVGGCFNDLADPAGDDGRSLGRCFALCALVYLLARALRVLPSIRVWSNSMAAWQPKK